jgi:hypothetical protein
MNGGGESSGGVLHQKIFEMSFYAFRASKFAPKFMITILVFEINKGKNEKKVKKITIIYHYLLEEDSNGDQVCGSVLPQKIFEI